MHPEISIIIPVYNVYPYLMQCLDSILEQNAVDYEVILVDDCSTDGSGAVIRKYEQEYDCIKVVRHENNMGQHLGRINGVKASSGTYLMFIDADDWIRPGCIKKLYDTATKTGADIVRFGGDRFDDAMNILLDDWCMHSSDTVYSSSKAYINEGWSPYMCLHFVRRRVWECAVVYFPLTPLTGEDNLTTFLLAWFASGVVCISDKYYCYRMRTGSDVNTFTYENVCKHISCRSRILWILGNFLSEHENEPVVTHGFNKISLSNFNTCRYMIEKLENPIEKHNAQVLFEAKWSILGGGYYKQELETQIVHLRLELDSIHIPLSGRIAKLLRLPGRIIRSINVYGLTIAFKKIVKKCCAKMYNINQIP